jgi:Protein of unknown function (DUF3800)
MKNVFFDESGNSGQNLHDEADPVFVLGSCAFTEDEEVELLSRLDTFKGPELKFSKLRKTPSGQRAVLNFLNSQNIRNETARVYVIHKPFMVVTKYCDLVLEPSFQEAGLDFYERGLNIATANLLALTMPAYLNPATWNNFLALFTRVVREKTYTIFYEWRKTTELIYAHLEYTKPEMAFYFAPVLLISDYHRFFATFNADELDPLIPAYHTLVNHWSASQNSQFAIIADDSKVLAKERSRLLMFSDPRIKSVTVGYDRRKANYPLKVSDILLADSTKSRQIQLADILSSSIASGMKAKIKGQLKTSTFAHDVLELCFSKNIITGGVWPTKDVTPSQLGTDIKPSGNDIDLASYAAMIMKKHTSTRTDGGSK